MTQMLAQVNMSRADYNFAKREFKENSGLLFEQVMLAVISEEHMIEDAILALGIASRENTQTEKMPVIDPNKRLDAAGKVIKLADSLQRAVRDATFPDTGMGKKNYRVSSS